ncbi:Superkiller protein 3 [Apophysomyces ossiformis]|uniref:Superkiller protein 3 n=1 Tax=Apophysomyces ossiformis TaxID=679940 RepID=A0A8H7ET86_9FUNG|nr:Superkiller protein 3 [Apophysomyces ossiformis]
MNTKADLKAAREAIGGKKFADAVKACKRVLMWESGNYNAWVFLGVAHTGLEEDEEAEEAYKRAIEINSTSMLAWQGLISFYEKRSRYNQLLGTIEQILPQIVESGDGNKLADYLCKLVDIYENKQKDETKYIETLRLLLPGSRYYNLIKNSSNIPKPAEIYSKIVDITESEEAQMIESRIQSRRFRVNAGPLNQVRAEVEAEVYGRSKLGEMYETILELGLNQPLQIKLLRFYWKRLPGVSDKGELYDKTAKLANTLREQNAADPLPYEILIEIANVERVEQYDAQLLDEISEKFPETGLGKLVRGFRLYQQGNVDEAFDLFAFETGLEYATKGCDLVRKLQKDTGKLSDRVLSSLNLCMAHCYRELDPKYYPDSVALYKTVLDRSPEEIGALEAYGIGLILSADKKYDQALVYFEKVYALDTSRHIALAEIGWIYCEKQNYEKAIELISDAIEKAGEDVSEYHYRLGRVYWAMGGEYQENPAYAFRCFMQAVKTDPQFAGGFTFLGHYYRTIQYDHVRAKKCYQKAFLLNPMDAEAALPLSDCYVTDNEPEEAITVFRQITELCPKVGWAWRRLGYANMDGNLYDEAITCFQKALRCDTSDVRCWEGLAEAYAHEGRYVAALKAFGRAIDLEPTSVHANREKALVNKKIGMLEDAITGFQKTLLLAEEQGVKNDLPTIAGLADTYLERAKEDFQLGFFGRAATGYGKAIHTALSGLESDKTLLGLWKLVGDACIMYQLVPSYVHLCDYASLQKLLLLFDECPHRKLGFKEDTCSQLVQEFLELDVSEESFYLPPKVALNVLYSCGSYMYKQALVLCRSNSVIAPAYWHDLALVYHRLAENNPAQGIYDVAIRCIRIALKLQPTEYLYWNALGVIAMRENPKVSQYALVKAMEYNNRDYELANQAFETAHALDPEWISAWVGQAYVASLWGTNALALFQHAFEASNGTALEASYGFAESVFSRTKDGASVVSPAFALQKLTEQKLHNALALNLLGLTLERIGHYERASEAFAGAVLALEAQNEQGQITLEEFEDRLTKVYANLGRALCASGDFQGAITNYHDALAKIEGSGRIYCQLGAGIAYYFEDQLEESLTMFEMALNETPFGSDLRQDVVVLLSKVLWALGGEEQRLVAKEKLNESISVNSNYLPAIFSLCVMGLIEDDTNLAAEALQQLAKIPADVAYDSDQDQCIAWLFWQAYKLQNIPVKAIRSLASSVHQHPWLASLWARLGKELCKDPVTGLSVSSAAVAIMAGTKDPSDLAEAYQHAAAANSQNPDIAKRCAQKSIILAPWRVTAWQSLAMLKE